MGGDREAVMDDLPLQKKISSYFPLSFTIRYHQYEATHYIYKILYDAIYLYTVYVAKLQ